MVDTTAYTHTWWILHKDWMEFNGTFSTTRLHRAFRSYSLVNDSSQSNAQSRRWFTTRCRDVIIL